MYLCLCYERVVEKLTKIEILILKLAKSQPHTEASLEGATVAKSTPKPALLTVDDDPEVRAVERDLRREYGGRFAACSGLGNRSGEALK